MPLQKATDLKDCSHDRWETIPRCNTDEVGHVVCSALKGLEASTRYVYPFDIKNSITIMCKKR
jgi:hypothetical protein